MAPNKQRIYYVDYDDINEVFDEWARRWQNACSDERNHMIKDIQRFRNDQSPRKIEYNCLIRILNTYRPTKMGTRDGYGWMHHQFKQLKRPLD